MKQKKIKSQSLSKSGLVEKLAKRKDITLDLAGQAVDSVFEEIQKTLLKGQKVEIRGLGTFYVKHYKGYRGTNPKDGKSIYIKAKKRPVFKPGKIKKILNSS